MLRSFYVLLLLQLLSLSVSYYTPLRANHQNKFKLCMSKGKGKGFGKTKKLNELQIVDVNKIYVDDVNTTDESVPIVTNTEYKENKPINTLQSEEEVFKKYNIKNQSIKEQKAIEKKKEESGAFGESVLAKFPLKLQQQLDSSLIVLTFTSLTFVVITG